MNLAVILYVAHWLGMELSAGQIAAGIATGASVLRAGHSALATSMCPGSSPRYKLKRVSPIDLAFTPNLLTFRATAQGQRIPLGVP